MKLKTYKISFVYDGNGEIIIKARTKDEAIKQFKAGWWEQKDVDDTSDNYVLIEINEVKP